MIKMSEDVALIKKLINEAFGKKITGLARIKSILERPGNIFLIDEHGGILFERGRDGIDDYRMTLFLTPEGRGAWGRAMIKEAFSWMFSNTDAQCLIGLVSEATAALIRVSYPPPGGTFEPVDDDPSAVGKWIYRRENWGK